MILVVVPDCSGEFRFEGSAGIVPGVFPGSAYQAGCRSMGRRMPHGVMGGFSPDGCGQQRLHGALPGPDRPAEAVFGRRRPTASGLPVPTGSASGGGSFQNGMSIHDMRAKFDPSDRSVSNGQTPALSARRFTGSRRSNWQGARPLVRIACNRAIAHKYARTYIGRTWRLPDAVES